jgi:hypothetical protein
MYEIKNIPLPDNEIELYKRICKNFKTVFDVGSREDIDYYLTHTNCEYHLFEPNKRHIQTLKEKIANLYAHNFIKINEFGLSDVEANDCVYYSNWQSFVPHWSGSPSIDQGERYSLKTLDKYVADNNIHNIDFLKIDVEGLSYQVVLGGLKTLKIDNMVSYIQLEYDGGIKQYTDLLDNFTFYLMMEHNLLTPLNNLKTKIVKYIDFNNSITQLNEDITFFMDRVVSPTGNGGNIFGINKNINIDIEKLNFKII